jgi:hypothetical protein
LIRFHRPLYNQSRSRRPSRGRCPPRSPSMAREM